MFIYYYIICVYILFILYIMYYVYLCMYIKGLNIFIFIQYYHIYTHVK